MANRPVGWKAAAMMHRRSRLPCLTEQDLVRRGEAQWRERASEAGDGATVDFANGLGSRGRPVAWRHLRHSPYLTQSSSANAFARTFD